MNNTITKVFNIALLVLAIIAFVMVTLSIFVQTQPFFNIGICSMAPLIIINIIRLAKRAKHD